MSKHFSIGGVEYSTDGLSEEGRELVQQVKFTQLKLIELSNQQALMSKAKNAYIADLKMEIIQGRTGLDLGDLLADD